MTGARPFATSTHSVITRLCSLSLSAGDSPVVPHGTKPCVPCPTCQATCSWKALSSRLPLRNGVISATSDPLNIVFLPVCGGTDGTIILAGAVINRAPLLRRPVGSRLPEQAKTLNDRRRHL